MKALLVLVVMLSTKLAFSASNELAGHWEGVAMRPLSTLSHILEISEDGTGVYGVQLIKPEQSYLFTFEKDDVTYYTGYVDIELSRASTRNPGEPCGILHFKLLVLLTAVPVNYYSGNLIMYNSDDQFTIALDIPMRKPEDGYLDTRLHEKVELFKSRIADEPAGAPSETCQ